MTLPILRESSLVRSKLTLSSRPETNQVIGGISGWYRPLLEDLSNRQREQYVRGRSVVARRPSYLHSDVTEEDRLLRLVALALTVCSLVCAICLFAFAR